MKPPVSEGETVIIKIEGIAHQGWGVGRHQGFAVFVPGTAPGEIVKVKVLQVKKSFARAELVDIVKCGEARVFPRCGAYDVCGGCHFQHIDYRHQLKIKEELVAHSISRIGKISGAVIHPVLGMDHPWNYRNRAQFHVQIVGQKVRFGFFRPGTHDLVPVSDCALLPGIFADILHRLKKDMENLLGGESARNFTGMHHLVIKINRDHNEIALVFVIGEEEIPELPSLAAFLNQEFPQVVSVMQNINTDSRGPIFGREWKLIWGKSRIEDRIGDLIFSVSPGSFLQVNSMQTERLYEKVLEYAGLKGNEKVIDLYCGIGTITLLLAPKCRKILGIEEFKEAVQDARVNARLNSIYNVRFAAGKAEDLLPKMLAEGIRADVIVVDPPRKGCERKVLEAIAGMRPDRIVYVSCDPGTLARDLKILEEKGYQTREVQPVDMFPQTKHVESIILIKRAESRM